MTEFSVIDRYFRFSHAGQGVDIGIGDDAAVLDSPGKLVVTVDTLLPAVHFPASTEPAAIGHKALAVNLSDLAAMGAQPKWFTLALSLPQPDHDWLAGFSQGLRELANAFDVALVGGDTVRGPLAITVQAMGIASPAGVVLRRGAQVGDDIYVSGTIGDAALGLASLQGEALEEAAAHYCRQRLDRPTPRVAAGLALAGLATAMIDCSDGLMADLHHLLSASGAGGRIEFSDLPLSPAVEGWLATGGDKQRILTGGDDYELIFTAPPEVRDTVREIAKRSVTSLTKIGVVLADPVLTIMDKGKPLALDREGYDHFAEHQ